MSCCPASIKIEVETPQHIFDTMTKEYTPGTPQSRDVFYELVAAITAGTESYYQTLIDTLWSMYRYRMISSCDVDYWVDCITDKASLTIERYVPVFTAYAATSRSDICDDNTVTDITNASEDLPNTSSGATEYLNSRTKQHADVKHYGGLNAKTLEDLRNASRNPYAQFAQELEEYFLPMTG